MARDDRRLEGLLGPLEAEAMRCAWDHGGPITVRELLERLNRRRREPLAYTTAMTVMARLVEKGALERRRDGRRYLYTPTAPDAAGLAVDGVLRDFGAAAVAHFADRARADPATLRRLRALLEEGG